MINLLAFHYHLHEPEAIPQLSIPQLSVMTPFADAIILTNGIAFCKVELLQFHFRAGIFEGCLLSTDARNVPGCTADGCDAGLHVLPS